MLEKTNIYEKNKKSNKQKIQFFDFLIYCTKSEISIQEVQLNFYWIGILEIFIFILSFILFCSLPKQFWRIWFLIFHVIRGLIGFKILSDLPKTSDLINKFESFENLQINEIQKNLYKSYSKLISDNSDKFRNSFALYWGVTAIDLLIDIIIFILFLFDFGKKDYNFRNSITIIIISILFSKFNFLILFFVSL